MLKLLQEAIWGERKAQVQLNTWKQKCSKISSMRKLGSILTEYSGDIGRPQKLPTNNKHPNFKREVHRDVSEFPVQVKNVTLSCAFLIVKFLFAGQKCPAKDEKIN